MKNKIMNEYQNTQKEVKQQEDILTHETINNNGLIRMIHNIKQDSITYENRNKHLIRQVEIENNNIDYLDGVNINSFKTLEENHHKI